MVALTLCFLLILLIPSSGASSIDGIVFDIARQEHIARPEGLEFPSTLGFDRLKTHECYAKSAKIVIILDTPSNRTMVADFFQKLGVLDYLVVLVNHAARLGSAGPTIDKMFTENPFTKQQYLFEASDHSATNISRYFPYKLTDIRGYEVLGFGLYEFPYLYEYSGNRSGGLVIETLRYLIVHKMNGSLRMVSNERTPLEGRPEFDLTFAYTDFRPHYMHDVTFKERGGYCILCPFHTKRDFLRHLLKPFSLSMWLVLGALLVSGRLAGYLFPRWFERNLLEQIFFLSVTPHRQPFPTRIVSFAVAVLIFFLSEAYNAKIISLMSVSKYFVRPETVAELLVSDYKVAIPGVRASLLIDWLPGKLLPAGQATAIYRERGQSMYQEYCTVTHCYMANLHMASGAGDWGYQQYVLRDRVLERLLTLQLATHSPFYQTLVEFFERYFQSGLWMYRLDEMNELLERELDTMQTRIGEVVFYFEDLGCVWMLIIVGWLLAGVAFGGELSWVWLQHRLSNVRQRSNRADWIRVFLKQ
uniref:Ionotropic glutamate receptor L-glutamate and glycine-binding domain-containing protein n=1 Tax=Anopheles farauti TaxID=69004 RepID=A0A182QRW6_9DIPT